MGRFSSVVRTGIPLSSGAQGMLAGYEIEVRGLTERFCVARFLPEHGARCKGNRHI